MNGTILEALVMSFVLLWLKAPQLSTSHGGLGPIKCCIESAAPPGTTEGFLRMNGVAESEGVHLWPGRVTSGKG